MWKGGGRAAKQSLGCFGFMVGHVLADASRSASHFGVDLSVKYDSRGVYKTHEMSAVTHVIG